MKIVVQFCNLDNRIEPVLIYFSKKNISKLAIDEVYISSKAQLMY